MTDTHAALALRLRQYNLSVTQVRQAVFEVLVAEHPLDMATLVARCAAVANRASVYRTVTTFETAGIVKRIHTGWKYTLELGEAFAAHHHHAVCTVCGVVVELAETPALEQALREIAALHQFRSTAHEVELQGLCQRCAKNH